MCQPLLDSIARYVLLTPEEQEIICSLATPRKLRKRQFLLQEGQVSRNETYVLKGCLRSYEVDEKGGEHVLQFSIEDWWVGDIYSYHSEQPSRLNIDALEDCELLQFPKQTMEEVFARVPKMERFFRILLQQAYVASTNRIMSAISKPAFDRYCEFIAKYPQIEQRVPNHLIASYLGITPESLSRLRKQYATGSLS